MKHINAGFMAYLISGVSFLIYKMALLYVSPYYFEWFMSRENSWVFVLVFSAFLLGGYKMYMLLIWSPNYLFGKQLAQRNKFLKVPNPIKVVTVIVIVPFVTFMPFEKTWYKFPKDSG